MAIELNSLNGPGLTQAAIDLLFQGVAPTQNFRPHCLPIHLGLVYFVVGVVPKWNFKRKGIAVSVTSHDITTAGYDPTWELFSRKGSELGLAVTLQHWQSTLKIEQEKEDDRKQ